MCMVTFQQHNAAIISVHPSFSLYPSFILLNPIKSTHLYDNPTPFTQQFVYVDATLFRLVDRNLTPSVGTFPYMKYLIITLFVFFALMLYHFCASRIIVCH
eukprot:1106493_1